MAQGIPDIRVLVGVDGASIDGKSGALILKELNKIASQIGSKNAPQVAFTVDIANTTKNIQKQLDTISKSIKVSPIDLNIQANQSSMSSFVEEEYRKVIDGTKGKKSKINAISHIQEKQGLAEIAIEAKKNIEITKQQEKASANLNKQIAELNKTFSYVGSDKENKEFIQLDSNLIKNTDLELINRYNQLVSQRADIESKLRSAVGNGTINDFSKELTSPNYTGPYKELASDIENYTSKIKELDTALKGGKISYSKDLQVADDKKLLESLLLQVTKYEKINDKFKNNSGLAEEFNRIKIALDGFKASGDFSKIDIKTLEKEFSNFKNNVISLGYEGQTAFGKLRAQMEKLGVYLSASAVLMGAWRQVKEIINNVVELDSKVTDLQIATGNSRQETEKLLKTYSEMGKQLGATTIDVANAADAWLRQGYSIAESNTLIKNSMMLSKLGQIDSADATKALTSAMKGYKLSVDDSIGVVDKFTSLDMEAAVSAGFIATAMAETSTGARLAGVEMDRLAGYITTVGEVTQDGAESVGTFYRTLFARMGNIKIGKFVDDETGDSLSDVESVLGKLGISLRDGEKNFRNFGTVLDETWEKWGSFSQVDQNAIAVAFSGTRQQEKFKSLMDNYGQAMDYAKTAANSAGTALDKYENSYLVSAQAAQDRFTAQFELLSKTVLESGLITNTYDTGTGFLGLLTGIVDTLGTIPTLATVASGALSAFSNKGWLTSLSDKRINALLQSGGNTERADIFSKRLYGNTSKWFIVKTISSADNNADGKILLIA